MSTAPKTKSKSVTSKKAAKAEISQRLVAALSDYKTIIGEKKFSSSVKKLTKRFAPLIVKAKLSKAVQ